MIKSRMSVASSVLVASFVLVLGLIGWLQGISPFRIAQAGGLIDDSFADFSGGTGCYVRASGAGDLDGEVIVTATIDTDFGGSPLVIDETTFDGGGPFAPGQTLEFTATFAAASGQLGGFGVANYSVAPFAIFNSDGTNLLVRTDAGGGETSNNLGNTYFGAPHRYRIEWGPTNVVYSIDGTVLVTHPVVIAVDMSVLLQDFNLALTTLTVDRVRVWPWECSFVSRPIDSLHVNSLFLGISTTLATPPGTGIAFEARTSADGISWGTWVPVNGDGTFSAGAGQYVQYRATLSAPVASTTPEVQRVQANGETATAMRVTSFSAAGSDTAVQGLLIGLSSIVLVLGGARVIFRRRKIIG